MRALLATLTLVTAGLLASPSLLAAPPDPKTAARALAERGYALFEAGKYTEAIDALSQADKLYHAPTLVFALARAHAGAGKLVEARALAQRVVDERLPPTAPHGFHEAQRLAKEELVSLQKRIPTLQIVVRGGTGTGLRVTLDDVEVPSFRADQPVPANPGLRRVTVANPGQPGVSRTVDLREGAQARVEIELPSAAPAGPVVAPEPAARPWLAPAIVGFGLGAAGLGLGAGAGVSALKSNSSIRATCGGTVCPASEQDKLSAARSMATASTVGFVVAGVGAAAGVILVVTRPGSRAAQVGVTVGPGSLGLRGAF